ncbi:hAT transposon superfamily protein [Striga asiatica]|uniref:HAT transposon superfamily protein n=1 Tax=Striga asiatica TaxID=4170 RepID=A0A5A7PRQ8_STRAF|nr:hAT transposon superfamily protein [Striga asiatica]
MSEYGMEKRRDGGSKRGDEARKKREKFSRCCCKLRERDRGEEPRNLGENDRACWRLTSCGSCCDSWPREKGWTWAECFSSSQHLGNSSRHPLSDSSNRLLSLRYSLHELSLWLLISSPHEPNAFTAENARRTNRVAVSAVKYLVIFQLNSQD